ncbi:hypothetical protein B0J13DRAFT_629034 [Dactylonectria estremocensis]|uniref:Uncharacterized protein n=1 Tax=Dactylonectria estremocensis TaxID=1079267 RepID=A0A9P9DMY6_9HYPO|nr:hypothetical protein B0J13DRAFT_629034 [Dactylonectria estremocensis]
MDPISLALAVIGLGSQLVMATKVIRGQINPYKSATQELSNLSKKLENHEFRIHTLGVAFNSNEGPSQPWNIDLLARIRCIMRDYGEKVSHIQNTINAILSGKNK